MVEHLAYGLMQIHSVGLAHQSLNPQSVVTCDGITFYLKGYGRMEWVIDNETKYKNYLDP